MFNITIDEPHYSPMDSIEAICPGWFHTILLKSAGSGEFHSSWMYEFRDANDDYYIQIKKELETGLIEVIYAQKKGVPSYPMFSVFFSSEDAIKIVATMLVDLIDKKIIKVSKINKEAIQRRSIITPQKEKIIEEQ
jgi:hypothetical protein